MKADLLTISQDLSLEDGSITNFLIFRLPNGGIVKALISEDSARSVAAALNGSPPPPPMEREEPRQQQPQRRREEPRAQNDGSMAIEFGGDVGEEASGWIGPPGSAPPRVEEDEAEEPVPHHEAMGADAQARAYREAEKQKKKKRSKQPTRMVNVPMDSHGYPIVPNNGGVDPASVVGGTSGDADEDGVGQA